MNSDNNDWKYELSHMLEVIEKQSTASLAKISQQFKALNMQFDDNFRQDVVKMTNFRLESSFMQVDVENRAQLAQHGTANPNISEKKVLIEINDSDDDGELDEVKIEENPLQDDNGVNNIGSIATSTNGHGCGIQIVSIKGGPNALAKIQATNATSTIFGRNQGNRKSIASDGNIASSSVKGGSRDSPRQTPQKIQKRVGRFKCKQCKYGSNLKCNLQAHERIHVREDSMGLARDPYDGLLHCPCCNQKFKQLRGIISHMQKHHSKH